MNIVQHSTFLQSLVRQVRDGKLLPASFQRPYVWSRDDVLALIESILLGYPIGGFLVWSPWGKADLTKVGRGRLGPIYATSEVQHASLLLDGQNRLATMAWILRDFVAPPPEDLTANEQAVWFNGDRLVADFSLKRILFVPEAEADVGLRMPVAACLDNRLTNLEVRRRWDNEWSQFSEDERNAGIGWFDEVAASFREARVVVTDMENATAAEAKHAFLHICKVGVPMSEKDFENAIAWAL